MLLAFALDTFSPHRGQRQLCLGLIGELASRGHCCRLYAADDPGELPENAQWRKVPLSGLHDAARQNNILLWLQNDLQAQPADALVGFSPMPGLSILLYGGGCYAAGQQRASGALGTLTGRHRQALAWEAAAFGPQDAAQSCARILLLDQRQADVFSSHYPQAKSRIRVLPAAVAMQAMTPELARDRRNALRPAVRDKLGIQEGDFALLFIGEDLNAGGIDRALMTLAHVREVQPAAHARLFIVGQEPVPRIRRLIKRLGLVDHVRFPDDGIDFDALLFGADLLVAPSREGAAGRALLEATAAGLPVVATQCTDHASVVRDASSGLLIGEPYSQETFDRAVLRHVDGIFRADGRDNALTYSREHGIYKLLQIAADIIEA